MTVDTAQLESSTGLNVENHVIDATIETGLSRSLAFMAPWR
jgi:hypothetical protein